MPGSTSPVVMRMRALQLLLTILYLLVITTTIDDCSRKEDNKAATQLTVNCRLHRILRYLLLIHCAHKTKTRGLSAKSKSSLLAQNHSRQLEEWFDGLHAMSHRLCHPIRLLSEVSVIRHLVHVLFACNGKFSRFVHVHSPSCLEVRVLVPLLSQTTHAKRRVVQDQVHHPHKQGSHCLQDSTSHSTNLIRHKHASNVVAEKRQDQGGHHVGK